MDENNRLPRFWAVQIIAWLVYLAAIYITFLTIAPPDFFIPLFFIKLVRTIIGFCLTSFIMRPIYRHVGNRRQIQLQILLVLICAIVFGSIWTLLEGCYGYLTAANFDAPNFGARFPRLVLDYAMTLTAWSALYFGIKYFQNWQTERRNALAATALANQAQLEMLRYQINPHFLFNSLNSIRASVDEDGRKAKQMITQLAEFLRYSLQNNERGGDVIPLSEEIEAARNYLAIEKTRFENRLEVEFKIDPTAGEILVPSFLLNPLIENAVKHGLNGRLQTPLKICIAARIDNDILLIEVANTGDFKNNGDNSKIGLKNVRERLALLLPARGSLTVQSENGWVRARIKIEEQKA